MAVDDVQGGGIYNVYGTVTIDGASTLQDNTANVSPTVWVGCLQHLWSASQYRRGTLSAVVLWLRAFLCLSL